MAAPKENQFWKMAANIGRPRVFDTPDTMWHRACEYFQWCDDNPWQEQDWVGKDAIEVTRYKKVPYTIAGFCVYLGISEETFHSYGRGGGKEEYSDVYSRIVGVMRNQKFTGAANGFFNANIIAKDLGLADKIQVSKPEGEIPEWMKTGEIPKPNAE